MTTLSDLIKEDKEKQKQRTFVVPVVDESVSVPPVPVIASNASFKELLSVVVDEKKRQKEILRETAVEVLPKLGDFFAALKETKRSVDVVAEVIENIKPSSEEPEIEEKKEEIIQIVSEITHEISDAEEAVEKDTGKFEDFEKRIKKLEKKLDTELHSLRQLIQKTGSSYIHASGGGGEVLFSRLDDVNVSNPSDWDVVRYDTTSRKFINSQLPSGGAGVVGGSANQVLVKLSSEDYDYEWQDMIVTQTVYSKLIDDSVSGVTYIGEAVPNTTTSSAAWRVQKISFDNNGNVDSVKYAASGNFESVWLNRSSLIYS